MITVGATLTVDGITPPQAPAAGYLANGGTLPPMLLMDEFRIDWGRESLETTYAEPATLTFHLLDATPDRIHVKRGSGWVGRLVTTAHVKPTATRVNFRGLVDEMEAETVRLAGGQTAALMTFRAVGLDAELANYITPPATWWPSSDPNDPGESSVTQAGRLQTMIGNLLTILVPTYNLPTPQLHLRAILPREVSETDALTLLREIHAKAFTFGGAVLVYDPENNRIVSQPRRLLASSQPTAGWLNSDPNSRGGKYQLVSRDISYPGAVFVSRSLGLDGSTVEWVDGRIVMNPSGGITQVEVRHDHPSVPRVFSGAVPGAPTASRRVLSTQSLQYAVDHASTRLLSDWIDIAANEMRSWVPGVLRLDTSRTGGFDSANHANSLLAGYEQPDYLFLQNAPDLVSLGVRPYMTVIGGSLSYSGGAWTVDMRPADIGTPWASKPLLVRNSASSNAVTLAQVDRSVTFRDLAYTHIGAGYNYSNQPA